MTKLASSMKSKVSHIAVKLILSEYILYMYMYLIAKSSGVNDIRLKVQMLMFSKPKMGLKKSLLAFFITHKLFKSKQYQFSIMVQFNNYINNYINIICILNILTCALLKFPRRYSKSDLDLQ